MMSEIADLTYNMVAFTEIMQMVWKRLNDHGKNWRHVYKALVLLEYLIKTGSEKVLTSRVGQEKNWPIFEPKPYFFVFLGGPTMQREHLCHPDVKRFSVLGRQQRSRDQCSRKGQGLSGLAKG